MLSRFRIGRKGKKEAEPEVEPSAAAQFQADTTSTTQTQPHVCHACGRPWPTPVADLPSPPTTASSIAAEEQPQNDLAWSSLVAGNSSNTGFAWQAPEPMQRFRPPARQDTWSSSIYSVASPVDNNNAASGWYSRSAMARGGQVRARAGGGNAGVITPVVEDNEYVFDLPQRTLSNYSLSFRLGEADPGVHQTVGQQQQQQQKQPLRFPEGLAILAAQAEEEEEEESGSTGGKEQAPPPMPSAAPPPPPTPRRRRRTISSMFFRRASVSSKKSKDRRSMVSMI